MTASASIRSGDHHCCARRWARPLEIRRPETRSESGRMTRAASHRRADLTVSARGAKRGTGRSGQELVRVEGGLGSVRLFQELVRALEDADADAAVRRPRAVDRAG